MARYVAKRYDAKKHDKPYKIYVIALAVIIVLIWVLVFAKVLQYEKGSTKYLLNKVVTKIEKEYGGEITYKRAKSVDEGLLYNIYKDDELFATTVLVEREEKGMLGFSLYDIGETKGAKCAKLLALSGESVTVNGKGLSELTVVEENINLPGLDSLAKHKTNTTCKVPQYTLYESEGEFVDPVIEGKNIILVDEKKGSLVAHEMSTARQKELKVWIEDFLNRYTTYIVLGKGYDDLKNDIFYTSPIYNTVAKIRYQWPYYYDYVVTMHEFNYSDFVQYTDDIVSVRVKYHYTQTLGKQVQENRPDINMYLYNNDGVWQIIEMEISEWTE